DLGPERRDAQARVDLAELEGVQNVVDREVAAVVPGDPVLEVQGDGFAAGHLVARGQAGQQLAGDDVEAAQGLVDVLGDIRGRRPGGRAGEGVEVRGRAPLEAGDEELIGGVALAPGTGLAVVSHAHELGAAVTASASAGAAGGTAAGREGGGAADH